MFERHRHLSPTRKPCLADKINAINWWNKLGVKQRQSLTEMHISPKSKHTHLNAKDIQLIYSKRP